MERKFVQLKPSGVQHGYIEKNAMAFSGIPSDFIFFSACFFLSNLKRKRIQASLQFLSCLPKQPFGTKGDGLLSLCQLLCRSSSSFISIGAGYTKKCSSSPLLPEHLSTVLVQTAQKSCSVLHCKLAVQMGLMVRIMLFFFFLRHLSETKRLQTKP